MGNMGILGTDISGQLREFAKEFPKDGISASKFRVGEFLDELASDIDTDSNLDGWNRLNLAEEVDTMMDPEWYSRLIMRFGMLVPIAFSWWSIREASRAYGDLSASRKYQESFLSLWVSGMDGGIREFERLPNAALVTFVTIAVIGFLGLVSGLPQSRLRKNLNRLMQKTQVYIGQNAAFTPDEIRGSVSQLLSEMILAGSALEKTSNESLSVIKDLSEQVDNLKKYVEAQTNLVGGELKATILSTNTASSALVKSLDASQALANALQSSSGDLRNALTPINQMIDGANNLASSSVAASTTLRDMVQSVPESFHEPIGAMISAGEYLGEVVAELTRQMATMEPLFASIGHARGALEIQDLLRRIENSTIEVANGQVEFGAQIKGIGQDFRAMQEGTFQLVSAMDRLSGEIRRMQS
jgi:hypothetical protein